MEGLSAKLAEILEVDEVRAGDKLQEFEVWDSLTVLSIVATLESNFGVSMTASDLKRICTIGELIAVAESRRAK